MNAPERIYLQVEGEEWDALPKEVELLDVTWCSDRIHKSDPEYLRSDLCALLHPQVELARDLFPIHAAILAL